MRKGYEWVMCETWVGDWTNCNILTPSFFVFSSTSFSFCWAAQSGVQRAHSPLLGAGSLYSILSPTNWLQLTELDVALGYIIVWHPPASCERRICTQLNPSTVRVIPWYLRTDAPVPWLTAGSKVNMLHHYSLVHFDHESQCPLVSHLWIKKKYVILFNIWNHLTVCKKITDIRISHWYYIANLSINY